MDHTSSPSTTCTNCGTSIQADAKWCPTCGQKAYTGPPSFWQLVGDFFETVFSLDNRLFRTLAALVVPGRLTNYFLSGKQKPYFHPFRLFFISGVLMIATYSIYMNQQIGDSIDQDLEERRERAYKHRFGDDLRTGIDSIKTSFSGDTVVAATSDSLLSLLGYAAKVNPDQFSINYLQYQGGLTFKSRLVRMSYDDSQILSTSELVRKYEITGMLDQYIFKQVIRVNRLDLASVTTMMGQIIWGLLLLVPLAAGMLKLFYIRRKRAYVEHFVFTLHSYTFIFLTQLFAALGLLVFDSPWMLYVSLLSIIVYFLLALKAVYQQSWRKTLAKSVLMFWGHSILLIGAISFTALLAVLLF